MISYEYKFEPYKGTTGLDTTKRTQECICNRYMAASSVQMAFIVCAANSVTHWPSSCPNNTQKRVVAREHDILFSGTQLRVNLPAYSPRAKL